MLTALALAAALADPTWTVSDQRSALDGSRSYLAGAWSTEPLTNSIGRPEKAMLALMCSDGERRVALIWPTYLGRDEARVSWRVGDGEIQTRNFTLTPGGTDAMLGGRAADRLMDDLAAADQAVFQVTGYRNQQEAVFTVTGAAEQVAAVRAACPGRR